MALCDNSVLTGQEGSIAFKPPGTSVSVRDWSAFGTDGTTSHITLECGADFRVGDVVVFTEESGGKLDTALLPGTPRGSQIAIGGITQLGSFAAGGNYGISGSYQGVATTGGQGTGATLNITTSAAGIVDSVSIADAGQGYSVSDGLTVDEADIGGTGSGAGFLVDVDGIYQPAGSGTAYYIVGVGESAGVPWIEVSLIPHGTPITMKGDGGTGTADNDLPAHINIQLADWYSVCGVREFSLELSRDELDITTLPCVDGTHSGGCDRLAAFRSTQAGYASATGTMQVYFTCSQDNIANRLLSSSLLKSQAGATVKLYVCTQTVNGQVDDDASLYVEAEISLTGMSFAVNPDDPTTGELSFSVTKMISAFGLTA